MAFPFFGKKNAPPAKPAAKKPAGRAIAPVSPVERPKAGAPGDERPSLDFTNSLGALSESSSFGTSIQISDATGSMHPAVEEAAMLYANDQAAAACAVLEESLRRNELGTSAERGWGMLFDLYQVLGRRDDYEALAIEFAGRFEKSPPAWIEAQADAGGRGPGGDGRAFVALTGTLNAQAVESLKQLLRLAETNANVRLDVTRIKDAENGGCAVLLKALQLLKKNRKECEIAGAEELAGLLAQKVAAGQRQHEETWLLLLELYQRQGSQDAFEEAAVDYAVTFEVSPPSWEHPKSRPAKAAQAVTTEVASYTLQGEMVSVGADAFSELLSFAGNRSEVPIDATRLRRMDFVSAGQLLNALAKLQMAGKHVLIFGVSHLIMGLFEILGIGQMAEIRLRRG